MKKISDFLKNAFDKQIDGTGLAVFRIAYTIVLLCEIAQMFYFRHLIFDKIPYIDKAEINFAIPIGIWFVTVVFILIGLLTRFFTIINYVMSLVLIGSIGSFEYHAFYGYMGINFLLIFLPISQCFSFDRLLLKLKFSNTTFQYNPTKLVSQLYYFIPPFLGMGLVYFDSVFYKLASSMWKNGLGSWLPSSLPMIAHVNTSWLLNQEYLIKSVGWLTIFFEAIFIFIFFRKKWRLPAFILGMILHLGIVLQFPIPWFGLLVCAIYLLLVPISFWKKIFYPRNGKKTLAFYYDSECPLCVRTKITITHFDWFNKIDFKTVQFDAAENHNLKDIDTNILLDDIHSVDLKGNVYSGVDTYIQVFKRIFYLYPIGLILQIPGIYHIAKSVYAFVASNRTTERCTEENCGYNPPTIPDDDKIKILQNLTVKDLKFKFITFLLIISTLFQTGILYKSWLVRNLIKNTSYENSSIDKGLTYFVNSYFGPTKVALGITSHPVFSNEIHFDEYNHIIAVVYKDKNNKEIWLPIINKNGQPDLYIYGQNWVNWTFRVNSLTITPEIINKGIERYTAFWAYKNGVSLKDATFLIKVKKIDSTVKWEKDFLNKQIAKPWIDGGFVTWENKEFQSNIKDIESL